MADDLEATGTGSVAAASPRPLRYRVAVVRSVAAAFHGDHRTALYLLDQHPVPHPSHWRGKGEPHAQPPAPGVHQLALLAAVRANASAGAVTVARNLDDDAAARPVLPSGLLLELARTRERLVLEGRTGSAVPIMERLVDLLTRMGWDGLKLASHTARQVLEQHTLRAQSRTDPLTGVGNRRALDEELHTMLRSAELPMALVLVDLDDFKSVNDRFTHLVGDEVLRRVAQSLATGLRTGDRLARYGGDEFVVLLAQTGDQDARMMAGRMAKAIAQLPWTELADGLRVGVTTGSAALWSLTGRRPERDAEQLFRRADEALLEAKRRRGPHPGTAPELSAEPTVALPATRPRDRRQPAVIDLSAAHEPYPRR